MADPSIYPLDPDDPTADLDAGVIAFSTRIVNLALSRIGVGRQVTNLATGTTQDAAMGRLHLTPALNFVLANFSWPFAKRYATLALATQPGVVPPVAYDVPVNGDWTYAFRVPADLYVARRIVPPTAIPKYVMSQSGIVTSVAQGDYRQPFEMGADDDGPLLFTDAETVELEYTTRPADLVRLGSPAFRSAVAWRLAAELCTPLARDAATFNKAMQMFAYEMRVAEANALNEAQPPQDADASWVAAR